MEKCFLCALLHKMIIVIHIKRGNSAFCFCMSFIQAGNYINESKEFWCAFDLREIYGSERNSRLSTNNTLHLSPLYPCQECICVDPNHLPPGGGETGIIPSLFVSKQLSVNHFHLFFFFNAYTTKEGNWGMPKCQCSWLSGTKCSSNSLTVSKACSFWTL